MDWQLVIDLGTGGVHVGLVDENLELMTSRYMKILYCDAIDNGKEFDPESFLTETLRLVANAIVGQASSSGRCLGIVITGQRHGAVFLDGKNQVVLASPNVDARAATQASAIGESAGKTIYNITARWPGPYFPAVRLKWLAERRPDDYARTRRILMLNEWLGWRFTGRMISEPTNAAETLLFDIRNGCWSEDLVAIFGAEAIEKNELVASGDPIGGLAENIASILGLPSGLPVRLALSDTQAAALGCGAFMEGEIVVVNGSTTPVVFVSEAMKVDQERRVWTSPYIGGKWLIEANANKSGIIYRALADSAYKFAANVAAAQGMRLDADKALKTIGEIAENPAKSIGYWGPRVSAVAVPTMSGTALLGVEEPDPFAEILPSYTENVAFAVVGNIQLARQVAGAHGGRIIITGGGSANRRFSAIVASLANAEVVVTEEADTTMIGAAASCGFGSKGVLPGMAEKLSKLRNRTMHVTPASDAKNLSIRYEQWILFYNELLQIHKRRTT